MGLMLAWLRVVLFDAMVIAWLRVVTALWFEKKHSNGTGSRNWTKIVIDKVSDKAINSSRNSVLQMLFVQHAESTLRPRSNIFPRTARGPPEFIREDKHDRNNDEIRRENRC
jgi:hypothetical protein